MSFWSNLFNYALRAFKRLYKLALPIAKQIAIGVLSEMALELVRDVDSHNIPGEEKSRYVHKILRDHADSKKIIIDNNDIEMLIKLAVSAMRNE